MKGSRKRGFTAAELVITLALISVLAAMLIPSFSSIVSSAQKSKDITLIRNIHSVMNAERASGNMILSRENALDILKENGIDNIGAAYINNAFFWDPQNGYFILYTYDNDGKVLYPHEYTDIAVSELWVLLDGDSGSDHVSNTGSDNESVIFPIFPPNTEAEVTENNENAALTVELLSDSLEFNGPESGAVMNDSYNACLSVPKGYVLTYCRVIMGNEDITSDAVIKDAENTYISIECVTGAINITAYAAENAVSSSKALDGVHIYGDISNGLNALPSADGNGYVDGSCLSTGSNTQGICATDPKEYEQGRDFTSTGWMEIPWEKDVQTVDVYIYIKDGKLLNASDGAFRYYFYQKLQSGNDYTDIKEISELISPSYMKLTLNKSIDKLAKCKYFRISVQGKGENLIVSFNKPIFPEFVSEF